MYVWLIGCLFLAGGIGIGVLLPSLYEKKINAILIREAKAEDREVTTTYCKSIKDYILFGTINGGMYGILFLRYGVISGSVSMEGSIVAILYGICTTLLLALVVIDWNTFEIPLGINRGIFILGLIRIGFDFHNWSLYVIGFFAVSALLYLLYWVSKGSWIGGGDVKLMAAAGLLLGWKLILVAFVVGCVMGSVIHLMIMAVTKAGRRLAFGPYLSLGIGFSMIWGEQLASWYLSLMKI